MRSNTVIHDEASIQHLLASYETCFCLSLDAHCLTQIDRRLAYHRRKSLGRYILTLAPLRILYLTAIRRLYMRDYLETIINLPHEH